MKTVLVYSGGLDSTCLLSKLLADGDEVKCLNFAYGSKHNVKERAAAREICYDYYGIPLEEIDMDFIGKLFKSDLLQSGGEIPEGHYEAENMKSTVVPFRNGIMMAVAAGYADSLGYNRVALGNHAGDHFIYRDCRPEFIVNFSYAAKEGTDREITIYSPFGDIDKGDIANIGYKNGAPLHLTWTCYKGKEVHCGKCGACQERKEAFKKYDIKDPTVYSA